MLNKTFRRYAQLKKTHKPTNLIKAIPFIMLLNIFFTLAYWVSEEYFLALQQFELNIHHK